MRHDPSIAARARRRPHRPAGLALVIVLAILVILAVMAVSFSVKVSHESLASELQLEHMQAFMLARSGLEHALNMLRDDAVTQPGWDMYAEPWSSIFRPTSANPSDGADVDGVVVPQAIDSRWINVRDDTGAVIGRYAVLVEDEAGKINLNVASAVSRSMQDEGIGPFEIILTDGVEAGLPLSRNFGIRLIRHRYGRDLRPGQADVDDNLTASSYESDLIDNDADGIVDEPGEGVDEQEEYDYRAPMWDDRVFASLQEAVHIGDTEGRVPPSAFRMLRRYATVHSETVDKYWDESAGVSRKQVNLNVASIRQLHRLLRRANSEALFEPSSRNMRAIASNIADYRDENHVLTTLGGEYGVEAVCFNEVMANDGSFTIRADRNDFSYYGNNIVHRYGYWYGLMHLQKEMRSYQWGWHISKIGPRGAQREVVTNGISTRMSTVRVGLDPEPTLSSSREEAAFHDFTRVISQVNGLGRGEWPVDLWKNSWLMVYKHRTNVYDNYYVPYPIVGNTRNELVVAYDDKEECSYQFLYDQLHDPSNTYNAVLINNLWRRSPGGNFCVFPYLNEQWYFPIDVYPEFQQPRDLYYNVYVGDNNLPGTILKGRDMDDRDTYIHVFQSWEDQPSPSATPYKGFNEVLDVDGDIAVRSETRMMELTRQDLIDTDLTLPGDVDRSWLLRTPYKDGEAVRARRGYVDMLLSTCSDTGYGTGGMGVRGTREAYEHKTFVQSVHFMRPDILELINISDHPISLANWRVVINTGSYADQVARIDSALQYSPIRRGQYDNPNPSIEPDGYFYLTNHRNIFDLEYGAPRDGVWGTSSAESYPCYELPDALWGVRYQVEAIRGGDTIICKGANWKRNQMKYELCEWHLREPRSDQNAPFGIRRTIESNSRNGLDMGSVNIISLKKNDNIVILGMPREGGFLSMTLKNEYDQITARTVDYGTTEIGEVGISNEKVDPAHYTWVKARQPSLGGTRTRAENSTMRNVANTSVNRPYIKDNRFSSVAEVQRVRRPQDWQNIGTSSGGEASTEVLESIARYFTMSGVRLDPEEPGVHIAGWEPAFGEASHAAIDSISDDNVRWEPNLWDNHTLRIHSGSLRGQTFPVASSTENSISVRGFSVPGGRQLSVKAGDRFSVGPGYATPLYYTRKNGDVGEWEWQNKRLEKTDYGLYLFGLSDSIDTTEFLEENFNAQLEVAVYNYRTRQYDRLPLTGRAEDPDDAYAIPAGSDRHQYEKSDGIYAGTIRPDHISPAHGIRLRIIPHNLDNDRCSGIAWFDYAYLAPGSVSGKINLNTASERVLTALNGVNPTTARAIHGREARNPQTPLPFYRNATDVLRVNGVNADLFAKICNLITTRSDQYSVQAVGQSVLDADNDGVVDFENGDKMLSQARIERIVDRHQLTDDEPDEGAFILMPVE